MALPLVNETNNEHFGKMMTETQMLEGFKLAGGVPRDVFGCFDCLSWTFSAAVVQQYIDQALNEIPREELVMMLQRASRGTMKREACHQLLHFEVNDNYAHCGVKIASPYAAKIMLQVILRNETMRSTVFTADFWSEAHESVIGQFRENQIHEQLPEGLRITCRLIDKKECFEIVVPRLDVVDLRDDSCISQMKDLTYLRPVAKNYPSVDAIARFGGHVWLLQMTQTPKYGVNLRGLKKVADALHAGGIVNSHEELRFAFIVPRKGYNSYQKQNYNHGPEARKQQCSSASDSEQRFTDEESQLIGRTVQYVWKWENDLTL